MGSCCDKESGKDPHRIRLQPYKALSNISVSPDIFVSLKDGYLT